MHQVGLDMREDPVVMRHENRGVVGSAQLVDRLRHGLQGVDVETRIGLVEDRELGIEDRELQDLVALLLATRKALVHGAGQVARVPTDRRELRFERSEEHTSELQSQSNLVCRLLLEKKKHNIPLTHVIDRDPSDATS